MKFIVDANLPKSLCKWLAEKGFDCIHTLALPDKNLTGDNILLHLSMKEERIVISKDKDFANSFLVKKEPYKLILITAGNLPNDELFLIFEKNFDSMVTILQTAFFIEVNRESITAHF